MWESMRMRALLISFPLYFNSPCTDTGLMKLKRLKPIYNSNFSNFLAMPYLATNLTQI